MKQWCPCSFHQTLRRSHAGWWLLIFFGGNYSFWQITIETPAKGVQLKGRGWLGFSFIHTWKPIRLFFLNPSKSLPGLWRCGKLWRAPTSLPSAPWTGLSSISHECNGICPWNVWHDLEVLTGGHIPSRTRCWPFPIVNAAHLSRDDFPFSMLMNSSKKPPKKSKWHGFPGQQLPTCMFTAHGVSFMN